MSIIVGAGISQVMAQQPAVPDSAGSPQVMQFLQPANPDRIRTSQLLGIPTSDCSHVIDLLQINQLRRETGNIGNSQVLLPYLTAGVTPGDLQLLSVSLVCDGDPSKGPIFQIGMSNNSNLPIGNFRVSVVGVLGQIYVHSPTSTVCIPRMEAGEQLQIQVQLPVTCMSIGPYHQQAEFDTVIVAVDSDDYLLERDELNNVQILKRCDIPALVVETPVPAEVAETTPVAPDDVAPAVPAPEIPQERTPSPLDGLDLDDLDLNQSQNLRLRHS